MTYYNKAYLAEIIALITGLARVEPSFRKPSGAIAFAIAVGITGSTFEELGWRGIALPALQKCYSALISSLILGLAWGIWHLPERSFYAST